MLPHTGQDDHGPGPLTCPARGPGPCRALTRGRSDGAREQRALDLLDRLRDLDAAGAGLRAVEGRAAAPHALLLVEDLEALGGAVVPAVEDEPVGVDDRGRAEVLAVGPE